MFRTQPKPTPKNTAHMKVEPLIRAMVALQCATMPQIVDYLVQTDPQLLPSFDGNLRKIQYSASGLMSHLRESFVGYVRIEKQTLEKKFVNNCFCFVFSLQKLEIKRNKKNEVLVSFEIISTS